MKHTPGPWHVWRHGKLAPMIQDAKGRVIADVLYATPVPDEPTVEANMYLIAAAPELLAACKLAKKFLEPDLVEPGRTVFWKLVAAIAKAEGRDA